MQREPQQSTSNEQALGESGKKKHVVFFKQRANK